MPRRKKSETATDWFNGDDDTPVEIRNADTGAEYGVTFGTFVDDFQSEGFEVVRRSDGQPVQKKEADELAASLEAAVQPPAEGEASAEDVGVPETPEEPEE